MWTTIETERQWLVSDPAPDKPGMANLTLCTLLWYYISEAEKVYGPRDKSFTVVGVEFSSLLPACMGRVKPIWSHEFLLVQIDVRFILNRWNIRCIMAHESVHLLKPTFGQGSHTTVLEEGAAEVFAIKEMTKFCNSKWAGMEPGSPYDVAKNLVEQLLAMDGEAIRKVRVIQPCLSLVTPADLQAVVPSIDPELAARLCAPMEQWTGPSPWEGTRGLMSVGGSDVL
jgi:hypothetical protein